MKRVIEHGKCKDKIPQETTCDNCGCKFTFTREDCYWSRPLLTYITRCPDCEKEVWVGDIYEKDSVIDLQIKGTNFCLICKGLEIKRLRYESSL